jgi:ABC-type transport system involved in multi-copper enzyme maturation permease subunit
MAALTALWRNPVLGHELRSLCRVWRRMGKHLSRPVVALVVFGGLYLALLGGFAAFCEWADFYLDSEAFAIVAIMVLAVLTPGVVAPVIVRERQKGTLDMLMATTLKPWEVVLGKLGAPLCLIAGIAVLAAPFVVVAMLSATSSSRHVDSEDLVAFVLTAVPLVLGLAGMSLYASARCKTAATATAVSYAVGLVLAIGIPMVEIVSLELLRDTSGDPAISWVTCPIGTWAGLVEVMQGHSYSGHAVWAVFGPVFYLLMGYVCVRTLIARYEVLLRTGGR